MWWLWVVFLLIPVPVSPRILNCRDSLLPIDNLNPPKSTNPLLLILLDRNTMPNIVTTFYCVFSQWKDVIPNVYICISLKRSTPCMKIYNIRILERVLDFWRINFDTLWCRSCVTLEDIFRDPLTLPTTRIVLTSNTTSKTFFNSIAPTISFEKTIVDVIYSNPTVHDFGYTGLLLDTDNVTEASFLDFFAKLMTEDTKRAPRYIYLHYYETAREGDQRLRFDTSWYHVLSVIGKSLIVLLLFYFPCFIFMYVWFESYKLDEWLRNMLEYDWNVERHMLLHEAEVQPLI
ncbi:unnamed protein product [Bursaphelenchus xylophilus]|uniref:(pine wood nematode) hypothetical protein n=1 Tax=Bursaphelenchus xylophilus TaxID=6326 RepID=A0A1I7S3P3_BURXY|nr:unnamed protein product [Bursaphelenchus xylophilus]CAG9116442.1 unnamed protein product [Bursaphelenchus xylophilus]